jgi:hypothetical protein
VPLSLARVPGGAWMRLGACKLGSREVICVSRGARVSDLPFQLEKIMEDPGLVEI